MSPPFKSSEKFAAVFGSPGLRVRFVGFARIFWPFMLVVFVEGVLLGCLFPQHKIPPFTLVAAIVALAIATIALFGVAERRFESFLKGAKGEEITARELTLLGPGWDIFHGIATGAGDSARAGFDFDHIVVGPDTVFLVETKNWEGGIRVENGVPRYNGAPMKRSPVVQVRRGARILARMLEQALPPDFEIMKIVCFASNILEGEEAVSDDVRLCNVRSLRSAIMESPPGALDEPHRKIVIETLARKAP